MSIIEELREATGDDYASDSIEDRRVYAKDCSMSEERMPNYVAKAGSAVEVQEIIKIANKHRMPVVPCSSGAHFHGNTIPSQGGIILDLRRMNKILRVDDRNRAVMIEPGVTWGQLQLELQKYQSMALIPLAPHPQKSVLTSHLEREPMLVPKFEYSDALLITEVVLPNGELFRTGSACVPGFPEESVSDGVHPEGPGLDWWRLFQGAQGTLGVITWANVKFEYRPKMNKTFFISFNRIEDSIEPIYRIQHRMIGQECLLLDNTSLAAILSEGSPERYHSFKRILPRWLLLLIVSGGPKRPEEKIAYEENALKELFTDLTYCDLQSSLSGVVGLERRLPDLLRDGWHGERQWWKFVNNRGCQDLFFISVVSRVAEFTETIFRIAVKHGYPRDEIGFYVQPLERGRACHFECSFYHNTSDTREVDRIRRLYNETCETLMDMGAFFSRPYGIQADLVYQRATEYTAVLRKIKGMLDPNHIMSPGRLCF